MNIAKSEASIMKSPTQLITLEEAGSGGYSVVHKVKDPLTNVVYALKKVVLFSNRSIFIV